MSLANVYAKEYFPHVIIDIDRIKSITKSNANIQIIGLTGSIASGKSTVVDMLKCCGAQIIDFDILAREVVEPGTEGLDNIVKSFGADILDNSGYLNRKALSQIVFRDSEKRKELERLIHPAIFELFCKKVNCYINYYKTDKLALDNLKPTIIAVIPLLIEMNLQTLFDKIIVVYLSSDIELERLMQRENIDNKRAVAMIRSQLPIDEKREYADFLIDNSGDIQNTLKQVQTLWKSLQR